MEQGKTFAAWMGIDWSDSYHRICMSVGESREREELNLPNRPEAIHEWVAGLRLRFGGQPVAVAVEIPRGALIYALMEYDFIVLFPINPKALAMYRKSRRLSGVKNDPCDARMLWGFLLNYWQELTAWEPEDAETRALRLLVEHRREQVQVQTAAVNRLKALLKDYYPQAIGWFADITTAKALAFLKRWPSLQEAQRAQTRTLLKFFRERRQPQAKTRALIQEIRQALALTQDAAILESYPLMILGWVGQLETLQGSIARLEEKIQQLFEKHSSSEIFASFPGAGPSLAPRLVVAFGTNHQRWDAHSMQCFSGIAPVEETSGDGKPWVHHRWICPKFLKQTFHEYAGCSIPKSIWAKAYYQQQRDRGAAHHEAVRALAFKWIRILTRCWKSQTPYSEQTYIDALRRRHSPLVERIDQIMAA